MSQTESSGGAVTPQDVNDRMGRELAKIRKRMSDLESENDDLRERVAELEAKVPDLGSKDYELMDRSERVALLRDRMRDRAEENSGHYAADYDDVINILDGGPSAGYAYTLMDHAGDADAFEFGKAPDGTKRLTVDL